MRIERWFVCLLPLLLTACAALKISTADSSTGTFVDAPVQGVYYATATQTGLTDSAGKFSFKPGETVTFSIGNTTLGSMAAQSKITVIDLVSGATDETNDKVTNIARLLQALDSNAGSGTIIVIPATVRTAMANIALDFSKTISAFASDATLTTLLSSLGVSLVSTANAQSRLKTGIWKECIAGTYTGTATPDNQGSGASITVTVSSTGAFSGTYTGGQSGTITGQMTTAYTGTGTATPDNALVNVIAKSNGTVTGTFSGSSGSGTFILKKQ